MAEVFANDFATTVAEPIDASETAWDVAAVAPAALQAGSWRARIDDEFVLVTASGSTTYTVVRGVEGSTAATHSSGAALTHVLTAGGLDAGAEPSFALSNIMASVDPRMIGSGFTGTANRGYGVLVEAPKSGTLVDLAVNIVTSAGNISVAVYDTGATTWTRLYTTGAIACPAAGWNIVGSMSLAVTKGTQYQFFVSTDSASTGFGRIYTLDGTAWQLPTGFLVTGRKLYWLDNSLHPAPATITAASPSSSVNVPAVIARIT